MKNRIKYLLIITFLLILVFVITNVFLEAKEKQEKELQREKDLIAERKAYSIKRDSNKYTLKSNRLDNKTLTNIYYDSYNVYLYYDGESDATLLKYNVKTGKIVILFENNTDIHGGFTKLFKYYKLGNKVYNKKFEYVMDYPEIKENEMLFSNLKEKLVKEDKTIYLKSIDKEQKQEIVTDTEDTIYNLYDIKNDSKFFLIKASVKDEEFIYTFNKKLELLNKHKITDKNSEINYSLLDDVPFLLKRTIKDSITNYFIYDANTNNKVYETTDNYTNYIFDNTKIVCTAKDDRIRLIDYTSGEEKVLLKTKNIPNHFVLAKDMFSLVLTFDGNNNMFYIFYL